MVRSYYCLIIQSIEHLVNEMTDSLIINIVDSWLIPLDLVTNAIIFTWNWYWKCVLKIWVSYFVYETQMWKIFSKLEFESTIFHVYVHVSDYVCNS